MKNLPSYSLIGGYPLFYLTDQDQALCPECATEERLSVENGHCNYESKIYCAECSQEIEAAYVGESDE